MVVFENHCVCCDLPCVNCGLGSVKVHKCDRCNSNNATAEFDGEELCRDCAVEMMRRAFEDLTVEEMAAALEIEFREID